MEERKSDFPVQFALSVSKKKFKRAVDRNRIRRLVRESYRLNKHILYEKLTAQQGTSNKQQAARDEQQATSSEGQATSDKQIALMVIYTGVEILSFEEIEKAMRELLRRFVKKYQAGNQN